MLQPAPCTRRRWLRRSALGLAATALPGRSAEPVTVAQAFDAVVETFMAERKIPGGALAVARGGKIVHTRGFGWADEAAKTPVAPASRFRLASISKPITAVAVMQLVEQKRLRLDDLLCDHLPFDPLLADGTTADPRLLRITVRHLLQHTAGWDRDAAFDPMFRSDTIAAATHTPRPASAAAVIRYMLGQPLQFDPGTRASYSNFGYCLLGRLLEKITGAPYETHLRAAVFTPLGLPSFQLGTSRTTAPGEVRYYEAGRPAPAAPSVFPDGPEKVDWPYGGFHLEAMDAHGGWIASAPELLTFALAARTPGRLLSAETLREMFAPPPAPAARNKDGALADHWVGCGWYVRPTADSARLSTWHSGSLPGTTTLLVHRHDDWAWTTLFNQRSEDKALPDGAIDAALHRAAAAVTG